MLLYYIKRIIIPIKLSLLMVVILNLQFSLILKRLEFHLVSLRR